MSCVTSAYKYVVCPNSTTTNCVTWEAGDVPCLNICNGMSLSVAQVAMATAICNIMTELDLSTVIIPSCLVSAWGTNEPILINFITTLLTESCILQSQIDSINTELLTFDPLVSLNYGCCSTNPCVTTGTVKVSVALQNIINCLCTLSGTVTNLQTEVTNLQNQIGTFVTITNFNTSISNLQSQINTLNTNLSNNVATLQASITCLNIHTGNSC